VDAFWVVGIVVDLGQPQADRLRHADDQVQAAFLEYLPNRPGRDNHRDPSPLGLGAANASDQSGQSGAVNELHTGQVDDEVRFTQAQGDGSPESRDRRDVQVSFRETDNCAIARDYFYLEHRFNCS
jgi:hypothetical protein